MNISQWYNGTSEKLVILLTNQDMQRANTQVRLRLRLEGPSLRLTSRDGVYYPTIDLDPGVPTRISMSDLAPYFQPDNLNFEGFHRAAYLNNDMLPEGMYQICFEAVEIHSGQMFGRSPCFSV